MVVGFEAHLAHVGRLAQRLTQAPEFYAPRIIVNNGLVARMALRRARRYVVSSEFQRNELLDLGYTDTSIDVVPNLFDEGKLRRWDRAEARAALDLPIGPDDPIVVFVGHYHDVKGHDVLIDAFRGVLARVPNARLVLAWSGIGNQAKVRAAIARAGIEHAVIELGRSDVGQLFSAADVVALPYRFSIGQAAYPGTVLEAMWVGAPLVTTNLPLLRELADGGRTALLAEPGDPKSLADQIAVLLTDPERKAALLAAQEQAMAERFSGATLVHRYVGVYEAALAGLPVGAWSLS
jgi:glycosyltransferase involved in cell wall biosynthesis